MARSIRFIGWSTAFFSIIIILYEISNLLTNPMKEVSMVFQLLPQGKNGMDAITDLNQYSRMWSVYTIIYFWFVFFWINSVYPLPGNRQIDARNCLLGRNGKRLCRFISELYALEANANRSVKYHRYFGYGFRES